MSEERAQENCPFYPACYWSGDCNKDDWKTSDCGLPQDEQKRRFEMRQQETRLRAARFRLAHQLAAEARAGKHDHLLEGMS